MAAAFVRQATNSAGGGGATLAVTTTAGSTGNILYACITAYSAGGSVAAVQGISQTNVTWTLLKAKQGDVGIFSQNYCCEIWQGAISGGSSGVTATITMTHSMSEIAANISEFSGTGPALDASGVNAATSSSASVTCTTNKATGTFITCVAFLGISAPSATPGGNYVDLTFVQDSVALGLQPEYNLTNSTGAQTPTWTLASSLQYLSVIVALNTYAYQASVTIPAASTSDQTNFTAVITGLDAKLATVANGGQIVNTVSRVGQTVPADLVISTDAAGYLLCKWGWSFYNATTGSVKIWVLIPTFSSSVATTLHISIGATGVTTYQGGTQGQEFDSSTVAFYHLPDGTTLSAKDFSANSHDLTTTGATATTGQIDGAAAFNGTSQYIDITSFAAVTVEPCTITAWFNPPANKDACLVGCAVTSVSQVSFELSMRNVAKTIRALPNGTSAETVATYSNNAWNKGDAVFLSTTSRTVYLNGGNAVTNTSASTPNTAGTTSIGARSTNGTHNNFSAASMCEVRFSNVARSADWLASEYANQGSPGPPSIGSFSPIGAVITVDMWYMLTNQPLRTKTDIIDY